MTNTTVTLELSEKQMEQLAEMKKTRDGKTSQELIFQALDRGLYDILYRSKRNKQQWSEFRDWKKSVKEEGEGDGN